MLCVYLTSRLLVPYIRSTLRDKGSFISYSVHMCTFSYSVYTIVLASCS